MKALVTGGAGFIGSHLSERLLAQGAEVTSRSTASPITIRAPFKERNLAALRGRPRLSLRRSAIARRSICRRCSTA